MEIQFATYVGKLKSWLHLQSRDLSRFQNADGIPTSNEGVSNQEDINKIGALYKTVPIFNRSSHLSHGQLDLVQPSSYWYPCWRQNLGKSKEEWENGTYHAPRRVTIVAHDSVRQTSMVGANSKSPSILLALLHQWCKHLTTQKGPMWLHFPVSYWLHNLLKSNNYKPLRRKHMDLFNVFKFFLIILFCVLQFLKLSTPISYTLTTLQIITYSVWLQCKRTMKLDKWNWHKKLAWSSGIM